jgi:protocatechuate 3,4-dioxygenase beta subunit
LLARVVFIRMKTTFLTLVTALVTIAAPAAQNAPQLFEAAQKLKPARVSSSERIAPATEPGTPFLVRATLLDPAGKPAAGVQVFAYQTDRTGIYAAPGAADPWRLKGWAVTDAQGRFEFRTIRPGSYPEGGVPAHIHLIFTAACCGRQTSELVFDDDPLITKEFRERERNPNIFVFGRPTQKADGSQEVGYAIRLRSKGDF